MRRRSPWSPESRKKFRSPEYRAWTMMKVRCYNKRNPKYPSYGGRGISVCDRWRHDFAVFLSDMGPRPSPGHSLHRVDNDIGYEPGNCKWATASEQARNRRSGRIIELNGERLSLIEWSEKTGLPEGAIDSRLKLGWSTEDAIKTPSRGDGATFTFDGLTMTINEWGRRLKLHPETLKTRMKRGWSPEAVFSTEKHRPGGGGLKLDVKTRNALRREKTSSGASNVELAEKYGISDTTVSKIVNNVTRR